MNKELSTLDQYLTDSEWGKSNIKETNNRKIRRNLLTNEELSCDGKHDPKYSQNFPSHLDHMIVLRSSKDFV